MPANTFRACNHTPEGQPPVRDWRECFQCIDLVTMQLAIARSYLKELATADFTDNGICAKSIAEPVQGRDFQSIAATGLGACSD